MSGQIQKKHHIIMIRHITAEVIKRIYDISNISEGGKIIAFIILGILLLIISFMYQKVKRLVIDEPNSDSHEK